LRSGKTLQVIAAAASTLKGQSKGSSLAITKCRIEKAVAKDDGSSDGGDKVLQYRPESRTALPSKRLQHCAPDNKTSGT